MSGYLELEWEEMRCESRCGHFDHINQCCWIVTEKGLCTDVQEGDYCHHGFVDINGQTYTRKELEKLQTNYKTQLEGMFEQTTSNKKGEL